MKCDLQAIRAIIANLDDYEPGTLESEALQMAEEIETLRAAMEPSQQFIQAARTSEWCAHTLELYRHVAKPWAAVLESLALELDAWYRVITKQQIAAAMRATPANLRPEADDSSDKTDAANQPKILIKTTPMRFIEEGERQMQALYDAQCGKHPQPIATPANPRPERDFYPILAKEYAEDGRALEIHRQLACGLVPDLIGSRVVIEVDWLQNWATAAGQALAYARTAHRLPAVILLVPPDRPPTETDRQKAHAKAAGEQGAIRVIFREGTL